MDFKLLKQMYKRKSKWLADRSITHPVFINPTQEEVLYTDGSTAIAVPASWAEAAESLGTLTDIQSATLLRNFNPQDREVSAYRTTVGDLQAWLVSGTSVCPLCHGKKLCTPLPNRGDVNRDPSSEEDDALVLHYGWIGAVPVDRRRIQGYLQALGAEEAEEITVSAYSNPQQEHEAGVTVLGKQWVLYHMGRVERWENAPKFQLEGKYEGPVFKAKKRK